MGTNRKIAIAGVVVGVVVFANFAYGASKAGEAQAEVTLQQVALFKNGLGFFVSEVLVPKREKAFHVVPFAAASHGTFWVAYPEKVKLKSLVVKETEVEELIEAISIAELLKANVGKKVKLYFPDPEEPTIEGEILYFAQEREKPKPEPYAPGGIGGVIINPRGIDWRSHLVLINTADGQVGVNTDIIRRVDFPNGEPARAFAQKKNSMQLDIQLGAHADGEKLLVSYLGKGVTWAPSYVVDISKEDKAQITAKAAVMNEVCDLEGVTLQLVTGFPHLQFADVVSPLALKENLAQFLQSLIRGERGRGASVMYNVAVQSPAWSMREKERADVMPSYGAAKGGRVSEDLFFYPLEKVQLAKGQVGYFPLFTETVPYRHIYQWDIPDYVNREDRYQHRRRYEQEREPEEEVWHSIRLENVSKVPWTTAPAQILKEDLILGQDTLKYTPVQGETTVRITRAVSVKADQVEFEIERKRDALRMYGDHFDLITVQGKLSVTNFLPKAIALEITKTLSGDVKSLQPEAKIEKLARGLRRVNSTAKLTWTIELENDEHKEIGYTYDVYVRR